MDKDKNSTFIPEINTKQNLFSKEVIIIGSGVSGISCARKLQKKGIKCVILEARNRIGGRILSMDFNQQTLDLGAQFIHGACYSNPIFSKFDE